MGRIHQLPTQVVNKIAAGEVIERPAAAVKELVENALDAQATRVEIHVEQGGARRIRVSDDGTGIAAADLALAFASHATSKILEVEDLEAVVSLGFRGEALPSIGAVARCRLRSRASGEALGAEIICEGGELGALREVGAPQGTTVEVENLFYNTPVRRRFLKTTSTELARVTETVTRLALSHPEVGFTLTHDGRELFALHAGQDLATRIGGLFGGDVERDLLPVQREEEDAAVSGHALPPHHSRRDRSGIHTFLAGRFLRDRVLLSAVDRGYHELLPRGRHPMVFLHLSMDPRDVDVNVHPTKSEVRFRRPGVVHALVSRALAAAVRGPDAQPVIRPGSHGFGVRRDPPGAGPVAPTPHASRPAAPAPVAARPAEPTPPPGAAVQEAPGLPVGATAPRAWQLHGAFLVEETRDGIAIIDQHALHERILTTQIREQIREQGLAAQRLLCPVVVPLSAAEVELCLGLREPLLRFGIDLDRMGQEAIAVHALPVLLAERLGEASVQELVRHLLATAARRDEQASGQETDSFLDDLIHTMACRGAIKFGDPLGGTEIRALLQMRDQLPDGGLTCAHGRPTTLRLTFAELERHFGRH
jgi:DNA mismatch repair protein MutL